MNLAPLIVDERRVGQRVGIRRAEFAQVTDVQMVDRVIDLENLEATAGTVFSPKARATSISNGAGSMTVA